MHKGGGPEHSDIAPPAEFLVDTSGTVRWTNFTEDIRIAPKPTRCWPQPGVEVRV
jgi:hypothetical protein